MQGPTQISLSTVIKATTNHVCTNLKDELILLDLRSGIYHGFNAIGARIWRMLQEPCSVQNILDSLLADYEVDPNQCENDLISLLHDLHLNDLITINTKQDC